jgi:hypothetical protein
MTFEEWYEKHWPPGNPLGEGKALLAWKSAREDLLSLIGGAADVLEKYNTNDRWSNIIAELRKAT